ncbi:MAG: acetyl-CoA carboxylase, carboxyltransferase subunit beta [Verrucomicrobium sp.]|nr:acetyl-CoA carboxylase, carboxyltransferase subunit beta [Verrucomicrobium sp.]
MQNESPEAISIPSGETRLEIPNGLWTSCPHCREMLYAKQLADNTQVCPKCQHHFALGARDWAELLADPGTFKEEDAGLGPVDALNFVAVKAYAEQIQKYQKSTGLREAVVSGFLSIEGEKASLAAMDFKFLGGSMGAAVGEKITRAIERATKAKVPVLIISTSGGARMHEGAMSLMQMAKTSGALARHHEAGLPFISILTNPTMGGVTASYASLGDVILAEPHAMVGFAGKRVIKETTKQDLPKGFQTAEFLLDRGLIDMIVPRLSMRPTLAKILRYLKKK